MWFMPTYGRPHHLEQLEASPGGMPPYDDFVLLLTESDPKLSGYDEWPYRKIVRSARSLGDQLRAILPCFPQEPCYGILTDDHYPQTKWWYDFMQEAAGDRLIAIATAPGSTASLPGEPCFGGGLVRAMGSIMPPKDVHHNSTDVVWREIGDAFNLIRVVPEAVILEKHPIHGTAEMDDTYKRGAFNPMFKDNDPANHHKWSTSKDHSDMCARIKQFLTA